MTWVTDLDNDLLNLDYYSRIVVAELEPDPEDSDEMELYAVLAYPEDSTACVTLYTGTQSLCDEYIEELKDILKVHL